MIYLGCDHDGLLVGNGFCNDETNNANCNYDGGDCCGSCIMTEFCSECKCLGGEIGNGHTNVLFQNGFCNDEVNNAHCDFDGFECCGSLYSEVNKLYCTECVCKGTYFDLKKTKLFQFGSDHEHTKIFQKLSNVSKNV